MLCKWLFILSFLFLAPTMACDEDDVEEIARQAAAAVPDRRAAIERTEWHTDLIQQATVALTTRSFLISSDPKKTAYTFRRMKKDGSVRDQMAQAYPQNRKVPDFIELFMDEPMEHYHKASFTIWTGDNMIGVFTLSVDNMEMFFEHHPVYLIEENLLLAGELRLAIYQFLTPVIDHFLDLDASLVEAVPNEAREYLARLKGMNFALSRTKSARLAAPENTTVFRYPEKIPSQWMPPIQKLEQPRHHKIPRERVVPMAVY